MDASVSPVISAKPTWTSGSPASKPKTSSCSTSIPDRLSQVPLTRSSRTWGRGFPAAKLIEDGGLAAPVRVLSRMHDDVGEVLPLGVGSRAFERERLGDAKCTGG